MPVSNILMPDDIDFAAYMNLTDAGHKVVSGMAFADDVAELINRPDRVSGLCMPWPSTFAKFRFRESEVTVWTGFNGHGKSYALGMVCAGLVAQKTKVCIASFEMPARRTLYRLVRQVSGRDALTADFARGYLAVAKEHLWLYDHIGQTTPEKLLAVIRYCHDKKAIRHFVIDSFLTCGLPEDGNGAMTEQKQFIGALCNIARDTGVHIHLVAHAKKGQVDDDEMKAPGKFSVRGSSAITDQADNVISVWRNVKKERALDPSGSTGGRSFSSEEIYSLTQQGDAVLSIVKQRNGEWEGRIPLWLDRESWQFVDNDMGRLVDLMEFDGP
jgi:twinkle protein